MKWFILPDGRKCLPEGTILKFEYQGGCYRILGAPVGYGGAGVIYPAVRVIRKDGQWEPENMWVALKECYPQSTDGMLNRNDSGKIVCAGEADSYAAEYYAYAKEMMRREKEVTGQIYNRGFRITPIWDIMEQEEISLDGEQFSPAENQYGIMERLDEKGTSLGKILEQQTGGCLTAYESICVIEKILQAIAEVHKEGYLHGDIQTNNLFLKGQKQSYEDCVATLIDFGSSRAFLKDGKTAPITDRKLYTTNGYRAPECVTGNDGTLRLTKAADLYSAGYLMLRMVTGKAMDAKALQLVVNGKYLYARQAKKTGCPTACIDAVNRILEKALKEAPEERYQSAEDMLEDITRLKRALAPEKSRLAAVDYDAFISYAHEPSSMLAAEQIQKMLERYRIPKTVQRMTGKKKLNRIFRDRDELACGSDLEAHLQEALEHSEYLIVLLSPKVPESQWVQRELEVFLKNHDKNHVLTVLTEGEIQDVYPDILRKEEKVEDGLVRLKPVEGLAADVRCEDKKELKKKLKTEIYRLLAPILGCSFDELRQRQKEYLFRKTVGILSVGMTVCGLAAGYMGWQAYQIQENYRETLRRQSRYLAQISEELLASGDRQAAVQVALEALPESSEDDSRPLVPEAEAALISSVYAYQGVWSPVQYRSADFRMEMDSDGYGKEQISPDGRRFMAMDENRTIYIWDVENRVLEQKWGLEFREVLGIENDVLHCEFLDENLVLVMTQNAFYHMRIDDGSCQGVYELTEDPEYHTSYETYTVSRDKTYLAGFYQSWLREDKLRIYHTSDGTEVYALDTMALLRDITMENETFSDLCFSPDGRYAAVSFCVSYNKESNARGTAVIVDLETEEYTILTDEQYGFYDICFTEENFLNVLSFVPDEDNYLRIGLIDVTARMQCFEPESWTKSWETDLELLLPEKGKFGIETDESEQSLLVWCGNEAIRMNQMDGSVEDRRICDGVLAGVQRNTNGGYLLGQQDGTILMFTENTFWEFGTNVTFPTAAFLDDGDSRSYLVSAEGMIACMKVTVDPNGENIPLEKREAAVTRFEKDPYYIVHSRVDDSYEMTCYRSEDDSILCSFTMEGFMEDAKWLEEGKVLCYLETMAGLDNRIVWYDVEQQRKQKKMDLPFSEYNMKMQDTVSGESYLLCFNDEQISMLDLETGEWTEDQILLADLPTDDPERRMQIIQTYMSRDGRYVVAVENEGFMDDEGPASLQLYDRQKGCWVEMPEEIRSLRLEASYTELVFMAEHKNLAAVFEEGKRQLVLWDLDRMELIQEIPFDGTEQRLVRFMADDSALLFWGNDNYLKLWDIETACIKMEDSQKLYSVKDMWVYDDSGLLEIQGFDETTKDYRSRLNLWQIWLYQLKEDGTFYPYVRLWNGIYDPFMDRMLEFEWMEPGMRWYRRYDLDELLEMGRSVAEGNTLTDAERAKYYIE